METNTTRRTETPAEPLYSPYHFGRTATGYEIRTLPFSDPKGTTYRLKRNADGTLFCPCLAFEFSKGARDCKHCQYVGRIEAEGAKVAAQLIAGWRDRDGRCETNVILDAPLDAPLPSFGGVLVNVSRKAEKVERYNGISI